MESKEEKAEPLVDVDNETDVAHNFRCFGRRGSELLIDSIRQSEAETEDIPQSDDEENITKWGMLD